MQDEEKIIRVKTIEDFDRELGRDGGETLEVPVSIAQEYGVFPEDVGGDEEIRGAVRDPTPMTGRKSKARENDEEFHRGFADQIIKQIKRGTAPWQKPWKPGERLLPRNLDTDRSYSGGNSLHLAVVAQEQGRRVYRYERLPTPWIKRYTVFNAEQACGLPSRSTPTVEPIWKAHQETE